MSLTGSFYKPIFDDGGAVVVIAFFCSIMYLFSLVSADGSNLLMVAVNVLTTFLYTLPVVPLIVTLPADLLIGVKNRVVGLYRKVQGFFDSKRQKKNDSIVLERLDPSKVEPYINKRLSDLGDASEIEQICLEIVRDQLGRGLNKFEKVYVLESEPSANSKSAVVTFVYRRCEQVVKDGVSQDRLVASAHVVRLTDNPLAICVDVAVVASVSHKDLVGIEDPIDHMKRIAGRMGSDYLAYGTAVDSVSVQPSSKVTTSSPRVSLSE